MPPSISVHQSSYALSASDLYGFQQHLGDMVCAIDCSSGGGVERFDATLEGVRLDFVNVMRYRGRNVCSGRRTQPQIRADGGSDFILALPGNAPVAVSQAGQTVLVSPDDCVLVNTGQPFEAKLDVSVYDEMMVHVPGPLLRQYLPHADQCCTRAIPLHRGAGKVLGETLKAVFEERAHFTAAQSQRLGSVLLQAIVNVLHDSTVPERGGHPSPDVGIVQRAKRYIESHLDDPTLDPGQVAAHGHLSISRLYAAFAAESGQGVAAVIRELRLQRCREALRSPSLRHESVLTIAMRWGFDSAPGFTRSYRNRFGLPPSRDRG